MDGYGAACGIWGESVYHNPMAGILGPPPLSHPADVAWGHVRRCCLLTDQFREYLLHAGVGSDLDFVLGVVFKVLQALEESVDWVRAPHETRVPSLSCAPPVVRRGAAAAFPCH